MHSHLPIISSLGRGGRGSFKNRRKLRVGSSGTLVSRTKARNLMVPQDYQSLSICLFVSREIVESRENFNFDNHQSSGWNWLHPCISAPSLLNNLWTFDRPLSSSLFLVLFHHFRFVSDTFNLFSPSPLPFLPPLHHRPPYLLLSTDTVKYAAARRGGVRNIFLVSETGFPSQPLRSLSFNSFAAPRIFLPPLSLNSAALRK